MASSSINNFVGELCVVCLDDFKEVGCKWLPLPCRHQSVCDDCIEEMKKATGFKCPICRVEATSFVDNNEGNTKLVSGVDSLEALVKIRKQMNEEDKRSSRPATISNAMKWKGDRAVSATIRSMVTDETRRAEAERRGSALVMASPNAKISLNGEALFYSVEYKVGKAKHHKVYRSVAEHKLEGEMKNRTSKLKEAGVDVATVSRLLARPRVCQQHYPKPWLTLLFNKQVIDVASYLPCLYWALIHHCGFSEAEDKLKEWGIIAERRKRRRCR